MPDLTLSFVNSRLLDDVSFHPCVRLSRWQSEKVLSFVPPVRPQKKRKKRKKKE
jgi:AP-3 complex subunit mu